MALLQELLQGGGGGEEGEGQREGQAGSSDGWRKWELRTRMCQAEVHTVLGEFDKALRILSDLPPRLPPAAASLAADAYSDDACGGATARGNDSATTPNGSVPTGIPASTGGDVAPVEGAGGAWVAGGAPWARADVTLDEVELLRERVEAAARHKARGTDQYKKKAFAAAARAFASALAFVPSCAALHFNHAAALAAGKNHEEAVAACSEALHLMRSHAKARKRRAESLAAIGRHAEAAEEYLTLLRLEPTNAKWQGLADECEKMASGSQ
eukprot:TRINITY_DN24043_c0_g1_i1.p1 TRINITY_DN24043_c0_g1~~TRINITY_DN24043_c0_g1_i1.p1  ORF type:complete len:308 (-),score=21.92 TRINITY_DN24043_c0_g1_i1:224-1033(-)